MNSRRNRSNCIRSPASQGRIAGYRIGDDQSAGIGTLAKPVPPPLGASLGALLYIPRAAQPAPGALEIIETPLVGRSRSTNYGWRLQRNGLLSCPSESRQ